VSLEKLLASLREKAEDDIRQVRREAETRAGELELRTAEAIRRLQAEHARKLADILIEEETAITAVARQQGQALRLKAEERLAARLYEIGLGLLEELRRDDYRRTFAALAAELPDIVWQKATVNPADVETARALFREAEIVADDTVSGGLRVASAGGRIVVDNTFEKRLQTAWPRLLPRLLRELRDRADAHPTSSDSPKTNGNRGDAKA